MGRRFQGAKNTLWSLISKVSTLDEHLEIDIDFYISLASFEIPL